MVKMKGGALKNRAKTTIQVADDEPVFTSGVVSRLLEIPIWILKQLDREKVVSPPRAKGRSRLYSKRELERINHVWYYMRERNVNVGGVKVILEMEGKVLLRPK